MTIKNSKIKANLIFDLFEKIKQEKKLYKLVLENNKIEEHEQI